MLLDIKFHWQKSPRGWLGCLCRVCYKLGKDLQVGLTEQEKAELNKLTLDELLEIIDREQGVKDLSPLQSCWHQ